MPNSPLQVAKAAIGNAQMAQSMLESMGEAIEITPVQSEVEATNIEEDSTLAFGTVTKTWDKSHAGRIDVESDAFPGETITCDYVSPVGGAGYGFFALPGIGATVLIGRVPWSNPPVRYFWMGCLYAAGQEQSPTLRSHPYKRGEPSQVSRNEVLDDGSTPDETPIVSHGIPNEKAVYQDNNLPDSFVLKHPAGHYLSLTDKNTGERSINEIKLKTAENKVIRLSDAPPSDGGECIHLIDENKNQIKITSLGDNPDSIVTEAGKNIETCSWEGSISQTVSPLSEGDIEIENMGYGDISVKAFDGHISLDAWKGITLTCGSSKIELTPTGININCTNINVIGGTGDVNVQGISHVGHLHLGNLAAPTSPPR
jgi:hypothetical protein